MEVTMEEVWKEIPDFPRYSVSNLGHIMNIRTEKLVKPQLTPQGVVYVPMYEGGENHTRSVKVLVARAFLEGETKIFDTPINKDGDKTNNRVDNLLWRPRWFAVKFSRQFPVVYPHAYFGPIYETETDDRFDTIYEVGVLYGLLFKDIFRSIYSQTPVFPTNQIFRTPDPIQVR